MALTHQAFLSIFPALWVWEKLQELVCAAGGPGRHLVLCVPYQQGLGRRARWKRTHSFQLTAPAPTALLHTLLFLVLANPSRRTPPPPTVMYIHPTLYNSRCKWVGLLQCMYACTVCIVYVCAYVRVRACTCMCLYELRTSVILRRLGGWDVFSNDSRRIIKVRNGLKAQGFFYFFIFLWKRICHRDPYLMSKDPKSTQLTAEREVGECKCVCGGVGIHCYKNARPIGFGKYGF